MNGGVARDYRCVDCYQEDEIWGFYYQVYKYKYCNKVYDTTDGSPRLEEHWCTPYMYDDEHPERRGETIMRVDLHCFSEFNPTSLRAALDAAQQ